MRIPILFHILAVLCLISSLHAQPKINVIRTLDKSSPLLVLGLMQRVSVSSGDVNGDGIPERTFVASDPVNGDYLRIVDGSDATRSWTVRIEGDPDRPLIIGRYTCRFRLRHHPAARDDGGFAASIRLAANEPSGWPKPFDAPADQ